MGDDLPGLLDTSAEKAPAKTGSTRDTFCVLAFNHLQLAPNGTAKMCCIASEDIAGKNGPLTLYRETYEELWNSRYMRSARKGMAQGEKISACSRCYHEEDTVGVSRRTIQNEIWLGNNAPPQDQIIDAAVRNDWSVEARPTFLQLNLGNLCNLACRMCSSHYSSRIAADPVHNKWMPETHIDAARWSGDKLVLGPRPAFGVRFDGFYQYESYSDMSLRWTNGNARIDFAPEEGVKLTRLSLRLSPLQAGQNLVIAVNGSAVYAGRMEGGQQTYDFDLNRFGNQSDFSISLASEHAVLPGDTRSLGIAVWDISVHREPGSTKGNARAFTRFDRKGGWWNQKELLLNEILAEPDKVRRLIFQGGEPLLIPEVQDILAYLVEHGAAASTEIELTSNMTIVTDKFLDVLRHFSRVDGGCSIDGIGSDFEYIRYPGNWSEVAANVRRLGELPNVGVVFNVAVQAYNMMNIVDVFRYCDANNIQIEPHFLVGPYHLSVLTMPFKARHIMRDRLQAYMDSGETNAMFLKNRGKAEYLVHFLNQHDGTIHADQVPVFMAFTNDMDVSRNQSFAQSHPELKALLAEAGHPWNDATQYAQARVPA